MDIYLLQDAKVVSTLAPGTCFGESILTNKPRYGTVTTREITELIRVEQKDFKILWEVKLGCFSMTPGEGERTQGSYSNHTTTHYNQSMGNPCSSLLEVHNEKLFDLVLVGVHV